MTPLVSPVTSDQVCTKAEIAETDSGKGQKTRNPDDLGGDDELIQQAHVELGLVRDRDSTAHSMFKCVLETELVSVRSSGGVRRSLDAQRWRTL